jgi:transcriptional regulator with PAS, ATPase and Fis domain
MEPKHRGRRMLIGWSDAMQRLKSEIRIIAPTNQTVIIYGERGTGKELVAEAIHYESPRADKELVRVNSATIPENLVESELFGCETGAYTGAVFRQGKFELAHNTSLFLDEIAEVALTAQAKMLRVLQEKEVDRLGGKRPVPADFRLIVATNRDLEEMIRTREFREDLYDRLNMETIRVPPLRERLDDIQVLAEYFIGVFVPDAQRLVTGLSKPVLDLFQSYAWPGNVRELENTIRRAIFRGKTELIRIEDLSFDFARKTAAPVVVPGNYDKGMEEHSRKLFFAALTHCKGNRVKARKLLGLPHARFYRIAKLHGIDLDSADSGSDLRIDPEDNGHA